MEKTKNARPNAATLERDAGERDGSSLAQPQTDFTMNAADLQGRLAVKPREAAKMIGVGVNCIYELCRRADFPAIRVGESSIIIPVDALRRWLDAQAERGAAV